MRFEEYATDRKSIKHDLSASSLRHLGGQQRQVAQWPRSGA